MVADRGGCLQDVLAPMLAQERQEENDRTPYATAKRWTKAVLTRTNIATDGVELVNQHWTLKENRPANWAHQAVSAQQAMHAAAKATWATADNAVFTLTDDVTRPDWQLTPAMRDFRPSFDWADTPWVVGLDGESLKSTWFTQGRLSRIAAINITRSEERQWQFTTRRKGVRRTKARERRWNKYVLKKFELGTSAQLTRKLDTVRAKTLGTE